MSVEFRLTYIFMKFESLVKNPHGNGKWAAEYSSPS